MTWLLHKLPEPVFQLLWLTITAFIWIIVICIFVPLRLIVFLTKLGHRTRHRLSTSTKKQGTHKTPWIQDALDDASFAACLYGLYLAIGIALFFWVIYCGLAYLAKYSLNHIRQTLGIQPKNQRSSP